MIKQKALIRAFALLMLLLSAVSVNADTDTQLQHFLVVTEKGGTESSFSLSDKPAISFAQNQMTVKTSETEITLNISEIENYKFVKKNISTSVQQTVTEAKGKPQIAGGKAYFSGLKEGTSVRVYTIDGTLAATAKAASDGTAQIDLAGLRSGTVYILRTPNASYKILNK